MSQIPSRRDLLQKVVRKLRSPRSMLEFAKFKIVSGDEYIYFDFTDMFPSLASAVAKLRKGRLDIDAPIFVAGLRRSGTTLFYRLMNANTELFLFNERFPGDRMNGRGVSSEKNIYHMIDDPCIFHDIATKYLSPMVRGNYSRWGAKLALELAHPDPGSISIDGMHKILGAFPRAKVLGITRDPRDFVLSALKRGGHDAQWWIDEYVEMMLLYNELRLKSPGSFLVARYEDLADDPGSLVRRCCDFSGLEFEKDMLNPSRWSIKGPAEYESNQIAVQHGKWRAASGLEKNVVDRVTEACFPMASEFGY